MNIKALFTEKKHLVFAGLITAVLAFSVLLVADKVVAGDCDYGGGVCEEPELEVDKLVRNPSTGEFEDHLDSNEYIFSDGEKITFKVRYRNTGDVGVANAVIVDNIPPFIEYASGYGNYNSGTKEFRYDAEYLNGDSDWRDFIMEAKVIDEVSECVDNIAHIEVNGTKYDSDSARICVGGKKEGEVLGAAAEVLPETGLEFGTSLLALSIGLGMLLIGLGVRKISESK